MIHLFLDTNAYLNFHRLSDEALESIDEIRSMIKAGKIVLWLPVQVKNEYFKNRENFLYGQLKSIKKYECKDYEISRLPWIQKESSKINDLLKQNSVTTQEINRILEKAKNEFEINIKKKSFLADKLIALLFSTAFLIDYQDSLIKKAKQRFDLGLPPGKNSSYGDAVIWESLLFEFPEKETLFFISSDHDFRGENPNELSPYLYDEWKAKNSDIKIYSHISDFVKEEMPKIKQSKKLIEEERQPENILLWLTQDQKITKTIRGVNHEIQVVGVNNLETSCVIAVDGVAFIINVSSSAVIEGVKIKVKQVIKMGNEGLVLMEIVE